MNFASMLICIRIHEYYTFEKFAFGVEFVRLDHGLDLEVPVLDYTSLPTFIYECGETIFCAT